jgi:hypothetical protein
LGILAKFEHRPCKWPLQQAFRKKVLMKDRFILLAEDNPDDEAISLRVEENGVLNEVVVARDGVASLEKEHV